MRSSIAIAGAWILSLFLVYASPHTDYYSGSDVSPENDSNVKRE